MKSNKVTLYVCLAVIVAVAVASPRELAGQTASEKSSAASSSYATQWSVQVDRVEPGEIQLAYSFQAAIYESLLEELNKTHQFKQVFREGDRKASEVPNLLVLKATVVKYTPGSETRRAVTTFSGATKLTVRIQLVTRDGKTVLDQHGERECSLLRQQFARYPQFGPQYRQSDQAIGMARIRAAGAILTSQLRLRTAHISWFLIEAQGETWRRVIEQRLITQSAAGCSKSHEEDR